MKYLTYNGNLNTKIESLGGYGVFQMKLSQEAIKGCLAVKPLMFITINYGENN